MCQKDKRRWQERTGRETTRVKNKDTHLVTKRVELCIRISRAVTTADVHKRVAVLWRLKTQHTRPQSTVQRAARNAGVGVALVSQCETGARERGGRDTHKEVAISRCHATSTHHWGSLDLVINLFVLGGEIEKRLRTNRTLGSERTRVEPSMCGHENVCACVFE